MSLISDARRELFAGLFTNAILVRVNGVVSCADASSGISRRISDAMLTRVENKYGLQATDLNTKPQGQVLGSKFEQAVADFVRATFCSLGSIAPGILEVRRAGQQVADFVQYKHLTALGTFAAENAELAASLGNDYTIKPDIVIARQPHPDEDINAAAEIVDMDTARQTPVRLVNNETPILHASISAKFTIRSDRSQNSRTEALNLIRNRKGRLPHIVVVTAEPLPSRLASVALGTGDLDCVYHIALDELRAAVSGGRDEEAANMLRILVEGNRLKDISDLPLDLSL